MKISNLLKFKWLGRVHSLGLKNIEISLLIIISLMSTVLEVFGLSLFLPIFQFIRLDGDLDALVESTSFWQYAIDVFSYLEIKASLVILLLLSFSFFLLRQLFSFIRLVYSSTVRERLVQILRNKLFNKYLDSDTEYYDKIPVGDFVNVVVTEVNGAVRGMVAPMDISVFIIMLLGYFSVLLMLSWEMTLASSVVIIIAIFFPKVWIKQSVVTGRKLVDANKSMSEFLVGRLKSPRLVRLSGTENAEKTEFHRLTLKQRKHMVKNSILKSKTEVAIEPFIIGLSLVFLYFSYSVLQLQIEVIGLYLVILMRLLPIVKSIVIQVQALQSVLGSIETLESRIKEMDLALEQDNGNKILKGLSRDILINKISYRYHKVKEYALQDISIKFKASTMTAIVGPSGSGKSTLIDLIPRLRLPSHGEININGNDINKYSLLSLRQFIAYVPQSPQIFNGTIKNHILYGNSRPTNSDMQEAIRLAGAESFINKLHDGVNTILGEDAVKLSGGQRQRLDLARALIRKSPILILDEPTSSLDAESEEMFKRTLDRIRKHTNTIIIIVAHRLASISDADQIIVLNNGIVEAASKHSDLLKHEGWYSKAWKMQLSI